MKKTKENRVAARKLNELSSDLKKESLINAYYKEKDSKIVESIFFREFEDYHWSKFNWSHEIKDSEIQAVFDDHIETKRFMFHLLKRLHSLIMDEKLVELLANEFSGICENSDFNKWIDETGNEPLILKEQRHYIELRNLP